MSEFKVIETQEELDNIIRDRLARNTKTVTAEVTRQYEGFISPDEQAKLTKKIEELTASLSEKDTSIADLTAKNAAYETAAVKARIAREYGLPAELADRLSGTNEQEFKADAEALAKFVNTAKELPPAPDFNGEKPLAGGSDAAYLAMLSELK
ncbi:MAG: DUF4355 domain-containing protein [Ruminococcus sp.]|nr:DUF4355 domain-containing protein [Ruminococcus sp.]